MLAPLCRRTASTCRQTTLDIAADHLGHLENRRNAHSPLLCNLQFVTVKLNLPALQMTHCGACRAWCAPSMSARPCCAKGCVACYSTAVRWLCQSGFPVPTELDGIVVLGGGLDMQQQSCLPVWGERRCDAAADVLALQAKDSCQVLCSGAGASKRMHGLCSRVEPQLSGAKWSVVAAARQHGTALHDSACPGACWCNIRPADCAWGFMQAPRTGLPS